MKFDYNVIKKPDNVDTLDNSEFIDYTSDILIELLEQTNKRCTLLSDRIKPQYYLVYFLMKIILEKFYLLLKKNILVIV